MKTARRRGVYERGVTTTSSTTATTTKRREGVGRAALLRCLQPGKGKTVGGFGHTCWGLCRGFVTLQNSASHLCPGPDMFAQASWVNEGLAGPNMAEAAKATGVSLDPVSAGFFFFSFFLFFLHAVAEYLLQCLMRIMG